MNRNLTATQKDQAIFLPAISTFFSNFIGAQRYLNRVVPARIPSVFKHGMESLNFLNPEQGEFYYKWALYSAGHAKLDLNRHFPNEAMIRERDRNTSLIVGDSGGYQIGRLRWVADWKDPNCPKALKKRKEVLDWMDAFMDYGMSLDVPAWLTRVPGSAAISGIGSYSDALQATFINNDYFVNNRNGNCKFLNVLQGENHADADDWYLNMKKYCDPKLYPGRHFEGWAMGGQNAADVHLVLRRLVELRHDGLIETGKQDWMHFLGTSKLEWAVLFTDIQRAVRRHHNPNFTVSFDCASPFLSTANGQVYTNTEIDDRKKWTYRMLQGVDDKKFATDTRFYKDAMIQEGNTPIFESSPIIDQLLVSDICKYKPGDLNGAGKEGKTSWDSFSYALLMDHNVYRHIDAVQCANEAYDLGLCPHMLVEEQFDRTYFKDIVEEVFSTSSKSKALNTIEDYNRYWMNIRGTRGACGKKTMNASTKFKELFEEDIIDEDEPVLDESALELLEDLE